MSKAGKVKRNRRQRRKHRSEAKQLCNRSHMDRRANLRKRVP